MHEILDRSDFPFLFTGKIFEVSPLFHCSPPPITYLFISKCKQNKKKTFFLNPKINCYVLATYKFA